MRGVVYSIYSWTQTREEGGGEGVLFVGHKIIAIKTGKLQGASAWE
jgi:hypothetical protein